jgi:hypothetical protein
MPDAHLNRDKDRLWLAITIQGSPELWAMLARTFKDAEHFRSMKDVTLRVLIDKFSPLSFIQGANNASDFGMRCPIAHKGA